MADNELITGGAERLAPPRHIAIILDGNGRWAKRRGLPRTAGHAVGSENFRKIATYCRDIGVEYLTVYAFSTENWKRPEDEVKTIMRPSFCGWMPRSEERMAFSIPLRIEASQGWISSERGSGLPMEATWLMGVGEP